MKSKQDLICTVLESASTLLRCWVAPMNAEGIPKTQAGRDRMVKRLVIALRDACNRFLEVE
jgi:hypothetical protein